MEILILTKLNLAHGVAHNTVGICCRFLVAFLLFVKQHFPLFSVYTALLCVLDLRMGLAFKLSLWPGTRVALNSGLRNLLFQNKKTLIIYLLAFVGLQRPTNANKHEQGL